MTPMLHWKYTLAPALAGLALLAGATGVASAAHSPAPAPGVARIAMPGQDGGDSDGRDPDAALEAAIDAEISDAIGNPAYARLRMLVNSDRLPEPVRATIARLLEAGVQRAAPHAAACRRLAAAAGSGDLSGVASRCREWLIAHADGPLALATCRRVSRDGATLETIATLVDRCHAIVAEYEQDPAAIRRICDSLVAPDATTPGDALTERCHAVPAAPATTEPGDASALASCVRLAHFAEDSPALIERCRALVAGGADHQDTMRTLRAELAASATHVGAETEGSLTGSTHTTRRDGRAPARAAPGN